LRLDLAVLPVHPDERRTRDGSGVGVKIIADDGTEYVPKTRTEAIAIARMLAPDTRFGVKEGHHVAKSKQGFFGHVIALKWRGPLRHSHEEAAEDSRRHLAGEELAPVVRRHDPAIYAAAKVKALATMRARSPDGKVHIGPPRCSGCGEVGHKQNHCPAAGWTRKTYVRKAQLNGQGCAFCRKLGHKAPTCPKRKAALMTLGGTIEARRP
jgi:hypothetical protein